MRVSSRATRGVFSWMILEKVCDVGHPFVLADLVSEKEK